MKESRTDCWNNKPVFISLMFKCRVYDLKVFVFNKLPINVKVEVASSKVNSESAFVPSVSSVIV